MNLVVGLPDLRFVDYRLLPLGLLPNPLHRHDVGRIHRPHQIEVLELVAHLHKLPADGLKAHDDLLSMNPARHSIQEPGPSHVNNPD